MIEKAEELLFAVRQKLPVERITEDIAQIELPKLKTELVDDHHRIVFWVNLYNAYYQILRRDLELNRPRIFTKRVIPIAGTYWSLDDIEHGILRKYRFKYSLGYFTDFFTPTIIRELAVQHIDYRIHFALNCGAVSCPPIAFYSLDNLENQLDEATQNFLRAATIIDKVKREVAVTRIMFWFIKDFGGKAGIKKIIEKNLNLSLKGYKVRFQDYSWDEQLDNFI